MPVSRIDHVAIPTDSPEEMLGFYRALGFSAPEPTEWKKSGKNYFSVQFGDNKINFHAPSLWRGGTFTIRGKEAPFTLRGPTAVPGCADICFVWEGP